MPESTAPPARIDAHLHLWEPSPGQYSWLTPNHGILYDTFTPGQAHEALSGAGIGQAILVQADDTAADTESMLAAAAANDWIVGVVGWLPLEDPSATAALLDTWGANPALCGVRTLIHDDPRANVLELDSVRRSLALVSKAGLAFDVPDAFPRHLGQVADLARALPDLTVVVDHLGKPPRAGTAEQMELWRRQLSKVAALPNTVAKFSGLHTGGAAFSAQALEPVWDIALNAFGPERLMFGGDWPVSLLGGSYRETVDVAAALFGALAPSESLSLWSGTARASYLR
ncbi:amidohydrolase family protein [Arthrobacter sp. LAPM80]|uniref:amidohydrolase family protein n=1 Tax=Arthrobacter sp. LAPM80 TaxID=3141788 RepID=UPI00398B7315